MAGFRADFAFSAIWGSFTTSDPKAVVIWSTTTITYRGEEISHLSLIVFEIPFWEI